MKCRVKQTRKIAYFLKKTCIFPQDMEKRVTFDRSANESVLLCILLNYEFCKLAVRRVLQETQQVYLDSGVEHDNLMISRVKRAQKARIFASCSVFKANLSDGPVLLWNSLFFGVHCR